MIRIDEIYNNIFWPKLQGNRKVNRLFYCDPPGSTGPENLLNIGGHDLRETDYYYFHDQEPIHLDLHKQLFKDVVRRNHDLTSRVPTATGNIIVSEQHSDALDELLDIYGWHSYYYFYHGWACLDWFRGYDKTFLIPRAEFRNPTKTFMSPNRIIGGKRDHRVLFLYHIFKNKLEHNHISAPQVCPVENLDICAVANKYSYTYPDIIDVVNKAKLPITFENEDTQVMASYHLTNLNEAADSLFYVPTETVFFGRRWHLTEKTFKPIAMEMPFILLAPGGSLEYLKSYGFATFSNVINEDYDLETNDVKRVEKVVKLLSDIDQLSVKEKQQIHKHCLPMVQHNFNHFYRGGFEQVLWKELSDMVSQW